MKIFNVVLLLILSLFSQMGKSQNIDSSSIRKIMNVSHLRYTDKDGRLISEKPIEASYARVIFYKFSLNKDKGLAKIAGIIIDPSTIGDSVGIVNYIFVATPVKNKLTKIRPLGSSYHRSANDPHENKFPYRTGDFSIEFKVNEKERLYFNSELTFPVEYNVGELLKK
jgi:hypothetical protein